MTWMKAEKAGALRVWEQRAIQEKGYFDFKHQWVKGGVDFVYDRQSYTGPLRDEDRENFNLFEDFVMKVVKPWIKAKGPDLAPDKSDVIKLDQGRFHAQATTNSSYGYIYIRAWEDPE